MKYKKFFSSAGLSLLVVFSATATTPVIANNGRGEAKATSETGQVLKRQNDDKRRQKCQDRKQGLNTKVERLTASSQRAQARLDGILDRALAYQKTNNLTVANFDNLAATAQAAKAEAAVAVSSLQSNKPSLDCNSNIANQVAAFKQSAQQTRQDLKAYKTAVKAVLLPLKEAAKGD